MIIIPNIIFIYSIYWLTNVPSWLANIDKIKNTIVNPNTKPLEFIIAFFVFFS